MKVDLHRHIGGSIRIETIAKMIQLPIEEIKSKMLYAPNEQYTFQSFLRKFDILDKITWDKKNIHLLLKQIIWDIVAEKINYCELKLSIGRYVKDTGLTPNDAIRYIKDIISEEENNWDVVIGLVLSLKYEQDREQQKSFSSVINDSSVRASLVGIDLVGDEEYFDADFYEPIFKDWKNAGLGTQAHVGESQSAENVRLAVEKLKVDRIAHGIKIIDCPDIIDVVKKNDVSLDIAISSNLYTGIVRKLEEHPIRRLFDAGVQLTVGTDDPVILNTTLDHEYMLAKSLGFTDAELFSIMDNSIYYAFNSYIACNSKRSVG